LRGALPVTHSVYGLRLLSNTPLPGLQITSTLNSEIDVEVLLKEESRPLPLFSQSSEVFYSSPHKNHEGDPILRVGELDKAHLIFFYSDGLRFAVARNGKGVVGDWPDDYSLEDAATYLLGPILGFVLRLRGTVPLHASCIAVDGRAIGLLGAPGAGKSTTAAAFARLGYPIVSEDVVPLSERDNSFWVKPGYPRINLWPSSVHAMFGDENALPVVTPAWGKRFLALDQNGLQFQSQALPLGGIYYLGDRDSDTRDPVIEPLDGTVAMMTLVGNTYVNYVLDDAMRSHEFDVLGRLVSNVPVLSVRASADSAHLRDLCDGIAQDARERRAAMVAVRST
jgi:hypothetical protein